MHVVPVSIIHCRQRLANTARLSDPVGSLRRLLTTETAKKLLGIEGRLTFTPSELRTAYLEAAKRCHPDTAQRQHHTEDVDVSKQFRLVTDAYEMLQMSDSVASGSIANNLDITEQEEQEYRIACRDILGVSAEVVEESKRCPLFRQWLQGRTDAAYYWNIFFCNYGGLAPKLRPEPTALIGEYATETERPKSTTRRQRRPQSSNL